MGRNALLAMLFLSLIVFDGSDAFSFREFRKLAASDPKNNKTVVHDSPLPSPVPGEKKSDPKPDGEVDKNKVNPPSTDTTQKVVPKGSSDTVPPPPPFAVNKGNQKESNKTSPASSPPVTERNGDKSPEEEKKENDSKTMSQSNTDLTCDGLNKCKDEGDLVACISERDTEKLVVLLQNGGNGTIKVKLSNLEDIEVGKNQTKKITLAPYSSQSTQLTLDAGKGDCVLHMGTLVPKGNFFFRLPSNDKILTPVNGAYFLILTVIVFGVTMACCKLRKKRHNEVPYQALEMALPESVSATDVETAEGWDQVWDDDWDEDVAVKSPSIRPSASISANGLTSRSSNKDGWENNWDD